MELRTLQTFQLVAEELNLTKAAIKLNYSQPTVTKHIKSLEEELNVTLLTKINGGYVLTHAGEQLYKHTLSITREVNLIHGISPLHGDKRIIHFRSHDYYGFHYFIPIINKFMHEHPTISFKIDTASNEEATKKVIRNEIDLAIVSGNVTCSNLVSTTLGSEKTCLCIATKNYRPDKSNRYYLENYPVIIDQSEHYSYHHFFQHYENPPQIINCSSDEIAQNAILENSTLGILRTGRLEKLIDQGKITVLDSLTKEEPISIIRNKTSDNDIDILNCFDTVVKNSRYKVPSTIPFSWN